MTRTGSRREWGLLNFLASFALLALFLAVSLGIARIGAGPSYVSLNEGDIAPNSIYAPYDFIYPLKAGAAGVPRGAQPVYEIQKVKKNELIVEKGARITKQHLAMLGPLYRFYYKISTSSYALGLALFMMMIIGVFLIYLRRTEPKTAANLRYLGIVCLLDILLFTGCKVIALLSANIYFLPFTAFMMLTAMLISSNTAVINCVLSSMVCAVLFWGKADALPVFLTSGLIGIYAVGDLRSRFQIIAAGLKAGAAASLSIVALELVNSSGRGVCLSDGIWGISNGALSSFIVMGLLPVLEHAFKLSTNITLLELSDMSHPLLKELALKAPGTYLHSHLVGNLAEAACEAIGANSLLARIGSYYHDIGKIHKAEYFSENETTVKSKHERLKASMSSLVIGNHVKEGMDMAQRFNLTRQITDIIQQHHGTGLMYFFYKKALEDINGSGALKEQDYRYPGPKPQTKEAAVVLLADSVEASSRTLTDPTPGKIRNMIQRVINNKFIDNQLDECDLTLRDLFKIGEAFVRILIAAFHVRTEYPVSSPDGRQGLRGNSCT